MRSLVKAGLTLSRGPIARSSIQSIAIRVTGLAITFAQAVLAARLLGAQQYGIVSVVLSVAQVGATIAVFGFGPLAVRELARHRANGATGATSEFVRTSIIVVAALSILVGSVLSALSFSELVPETYRRTLCFGGLVVLPLALLQLQRGVAQGLGWIAGAQIPGEVLRPALFVCALLIAAFIDFPLNPINYLAGFALTGFTIMIISLALTWRGILSPIKRYRNLADRQRWRLEAMPFFGLALIGILLAEVDTLLLGWLATPKEAGLFQPIARLAPLMVISVQAASMRFAPRISELWEQKEYKKIQKLTRIFIYSTSTLTAATALIFAASGPWLMAVFGSEFIASARLLWIIGAAQLFSAACGPVDVLLTMRGRTHAALIGQIAGLAANCVAGLWLIPRHGALGAAVAMACGIVAANIVMVIMQRTDQVQMSVD